MARRWLPFGFGIVCFVLGAAASAVFLEIGRDEADFPPEANLNGEAGFAGGDDRAFEPGQVPAVPAIRPVPLPSGLRPLQERLTRANAQIDEIFLDPLSSNRLVELIYNARLEWAQRLEKCTDDACRSGILADQQRRADYVLGGGGGGFPGLPWRLGSFSVEGDWGGGIVNIYPIIDDVLLVRILTGGRPDARGYVSSCTLNAQGRIGEVIWLTSLDEWEQSYNLRPNGADRLSIEAPPGVHSAHCGVGATVEDDFAVTPSPTRSAAATLES